MEELMTYLLAPAGQIALIIGIAQLAKNLGLKTKFIPLLDVALGLLSGILVYGIEANYGMTKGVMLGLAIGLSACGLFSGIKNVMSKENDK